MDRIQGRPPQRVEGSGATVSTECLVKQFLLSTVKPQPHVPLEATQVMVGMDGGSLERSSGSPTPVVCCLELQHMPRAGERQ